MKPLTERNELNNNDFERHRSHASVGRRFYEILTHQFLNKIESYLDVYGYEELGFDFGEGAWETAATTKVRQQARNLPNGKWFRGREWK